MEAVAVIVGAAIYALAILVGVVVIQSLLPKSRPSKPENTMWWNQPWTTGRAPSEPAFQTLGVSTGRYSSKVPNIVEMDYSEMEARVAAQLVGHTFQPTSVDDCLKIVEEYAKLVGEVSPGLAVDNDVKMQVCAIIADIAGVDTISPAQLLFEDLGFTPELRRELHLRVEYAIGRLLPDPAYRAHYVSTFVYYVELAAEGKL